MPMSSKRIMGGTNTSDGYDSSSGYRVVETGSADLSVLDVRSLAFASRSGQSETE